jgi:hypothetical protein
MWKEALPNLIIRRPIIIRHIGQFRGFFRQSLCVLSEAAEEISKKREKTVMFFIMFSFGKIFDFSFLLEGITHIRDLYRGVIESTK